MWPVVNLFESGLEITEWVDIDTIHSMEESYPLYKNKVMEITKANNITPYLKREMLGDLEDLKQNIYNLTHADTSEDSWEYYNLCSRTMDKLDCKIRWTN